MKIAARIVLFLILILCFSCEEYGFFVKCPDCTTEEPIEINLEIKLDINPFSSSTGESTIIKVYEGNLEDNILYGSYKVTGKRTTVPVTINKKYTVTATYYRPDNIYITVDSATPRIRYDKDQCDEPCYFVYNSVCDLRLKYTK